MKDFSLKYKKVIAAVVIVVCMTAVLAVGTHFTMKDSGKNLFDIIFPVTEGVSTETVTSPAATEAVTTEPPYVSPKDFDALQSEINPEIYAWVTLPGTTVDLPVLQDDDTPEFYLDHDMYGNYDPNGCLFTQYFNTLSFDDAMTIIYGHNQVYNSMFSDLIKFADKGFFDEHSEMTVYLPHTEKHYKLIASVPFEAKHLLYYWDFSREEDFDDFFNTLFNYPYVVLADDAEEEVEFGDRFVVFSTCYYNFSEMRFLLVWKEIGS